MKGYDSSPALMGEEFLSLVSHEIRSPLTSITGFATFAEDAVKNNDRTAALESLEVVRSEAHRILRLAEDLLDASCLRAGKFRLTIGEVDVAPLVARIAGRHAATSGREIEVCSAAMVPAIRGDLYRMVQVVENLLSNAIKYSPEGTPIRVTVESDASIVRISISNRGAIIPPEKLAMLFQRFSRLRMEDHGGERPKGTGLGLYIVRKIVEGHGGTIRATSTAEGTTFAVELPRLSVDAGNEIAN